MSRRININELSDYQLEKISDDLLVTQKLEKKSRYGNAKPQTISVFDVEGDNAYIPFAYARKFSRPKRKELASINVQFEGKLRALQEEVKSEAIEQMNKTGSVIISLYCGGGKTCTAIYIATRIKLKAMVICNRITLMKQWKSAIKKFCPSAKAQILEPGEKKDPKADFYIMNAINIEKRPRTEYADIGFVIVDELHLIMAEKVSKCMTYLVPRYCLGLSATPYRLDGFNEILDLYFGRDKIYRKLYREHDVYRVNTRFKPEVELNANGRLDWNSVLTSQGESVERNELIIRVIKKFSDRVFMVLCKRVSQAKYLVKRLKEEGEDVTSLFGTNQVFKESSRILVGTNSKCGTGFDHPRLNALIIAADLQQYFIQYLGRVFRTEEHTPLIIDFVDDHGVLLKHYRTRAGVYKEHGGKIVDFSKLHPDFELL